MAKESLTSCEQERYQFLKFPITWMPAGAEHGLCGAGSPFPTPGCIGSLSEQKPHFGSK